MYWRSSPPMRDWVTLDGVLNQPGSRTYAEWFGQSEPNEDGGERYPEQDDAVPVHPRFDASIERIQIHHVDFGSNGK